ncbi:hypothetical protein B4U80_09692 [Leptotrombidium deliense]|uniref:BTB domain-containing protein n=1 Tax=Leptotrombidium deliense TaxID=299467 RepID=A0A443S027_9ACAR|nr:hypothetical protein B4U80_09692 [Leptotrombidium deliense]
MSTNVAMENLKKMFGDPRFSDVCFIIEDAVFYVHKSILASSCAYFEAMLYGETAESKMKTINLSSTPKRAFELTMQFIYTGGSIEKEINAKDAVELLSTFTNNWWILLCRTFIYRILN